MKHVPNGREERKNSQGRDPRAHERKSSANHMQSGRLIVREMEKYAFENPIDVSC